MHYIQKNLINIIAALRRADAFHACINQNYKKPSENRIFTIWPANTELLQTEMDDAIDSIDMHVISTAEHLSTGIPVLAIQQLPISHALYVLYKQIRAGLVSNGFSFDKRADGGVLHVNAQGYAYLTYDSTLASSSPRKIWAHTL